MNVTDTVARLQMDLDSLTVHLTGGAILSLPINSPMFSVVLALVLASFANAIKINFNHDGGGKILSLITVPG